MCIICPILKTQNLASVLLTLLCSGCKSNINLYFCLDSCYWPPLSRWVYYIGGNRWRLFFRHHYPQIVTNFMSSTSRGHDNHKISQSFYSRHWIECLYVLVHWNRCWWLVERIQNLLRILRFRRLGIDLWMVCWNLWFNFMEWYAGKKWSCELYITNPWMVRCDFSFSFNCCWSMEHVVLCAIRKCFYL